MIADLRLHVQIACPLAEFTKTPRQSPPFSRPFLIAGNYWQEDAMRTVRGHLRAIYAT